VIDWSLVEDAVRAWVLAGSGLAPDLVFFADQDLPTSEVQPRISIRIGDGNRVGQAALQHTFDAGQPLGQEIQFAAQQMLEIVVDLQAFAPRTTGTPTARTVMASVLASLALPSVRDALNAAGLGVLEEGSVQRLPQVRSATNEDRAIASVRLLVKQEATERTGYIASVESSGSVDGA
jgi:hypothetical protein